MTTSEPDASSLRVFGQPLGFMAYAGLLADAVQMGVRPLSALAFLRPRLERLPDGSTDEERRVRSELDGDVQKRLLAASIRVDRIRANQYGLVSDRLLGSGRRIRPNRDWSSRSPAFEPRHDVLNLIGHAEAEGVGVTWSTLPEAKAGFVLRPAEGSIAVRRDQDHHPKHVDPRDLPRVAMVDVVVMLNRSQQWAQTFDVLVHELAHLLLGHVGVMKGHRQGRLAITSGQPLTTEVMEFEVFSVGLMVALRRGAVSETVMRSLAIQYLKVRRDRLLDEVNVLEVFVVAEVLCWWCASGPHRSSVLSNPRTGPVRPVGSSTKNPAAPQDMAKAVVSGRHESGENEKIDL